MNFSTDGVYPFGAPAACVLGRELRRRALAGDVAALRALLNAVPVDLPSSVVAAWRRGEIRRIGQWLAEQLPELTTNSRAQIVFAAGAARDQQRAASPNARLTAEQHAELVARVDAILARLPARRNGGRWLGKRMINAILAD